MDWGGNMGNLKVPESPTTYTTHYEDLKGIDCYTPNTEISNNHAADMVNMYPEGGIPIKRRGWRKIQEFDSKIITAYYDVYNDVSYVATENGIAVRGGTFDRTVSRTVPYDDITIDTNITFKLLNLVPTAEYDEPYKAILSIMASVRYGSSSLRFHYFYGDELRYFSFDANNNVYISASDFCTLVGITDMSTVYNLKFDAKYIQTTALIEIPSSPVKHIVPFSGKIYFIANDGIFTLEEWTVTPIAWKVPLTKFALEANGTSGQAYYPVNAMIQEQSYQFRSDGNGKFYPHGTGFNTANKVNYIFKVKKVEVFDGVEWNVSPASHYSIVTENTTHTILDADGDQTTIQSDYYVTFANGHIPAASTVTDNVRITCEELDVEVKETVGGVNIYWGQYNRLKRKLLDAEILSIYGSVDTDRIFLVVDANKLYYSDSGDISYFPDDNYIVAGNYAPIVGLHKKDDYLVAVTGESDSHAIYLIKSSTAVVTEQVIQGDGSTDNASHEEQFFSVHPAASGKGAIAPRSFATLADDPLYLGTQGIYSISSNYYTSQTMIVNRSTFINPKLLVEPNLENAISCIWKHFYCVFINGHVYMLDADNMTRDTAGNKCYEGYFLDNVPATNVVLPTRDTLYFANGKYLCKFNTDIEGHQAYYDDGTYDDSLELVFGEQIVGCMWEGKLDDDGYPQYFKNLSKKGVVVTVLAQDESSVNIYLSKNGDEYIQTAKMADMETDGITIDIYPLKKIKKYKRLKFRIENDEPEPFGLVKIVKTWSLGNYAK